MSQRSGSAVENLRRIPQYYQHLSRSMDDDAAAEEAVNLADQLNAELLCKILGKLPSAGDVGRAACVASSWRNAAADELIWRRHVREVTSLGEATRISHIEGSGCVWPVRILLF